MKYFQLLYAFHIFSSHTLIYYIFKKFFHIYLLYIPSSKTGSSLVLLNFFGKVPKCFLYNQADSKQHNIQFKRCRVHFQGLFLWKKKVSDDWKYSTYLVYNFYVHNHIDCWPDILLHSYNFHNLNTHTHFSHQTQRKGM